MSRIFSTEPFITAHSMVQGNQVQGNGLTLLTFPRTFTYMHWNGSLIQYAGISTGTCSMLQLTASRIHRIISSLTLLSVEAGLVILTQPQPFRSTTTLITFTYFKRNLNPCHPTREADQTAHVQVRRKQDRARLPAHQMFCWQNCA